MRTVIDTLIAVVLLGMLAGVGWYKLRGAEEDKRVTVTQAALQLIHGQVLYHAGLGDVPLNKSGHPVSIDAGWFETEPTNACVEGEAPWMQVAQEAAYRQRHPKKIVADIDHAMFWYNPYLGVVRARVSAQISEQETVTLYNQVNGATLEAGELEW